MTQISLTTTWQSLGSGPFALQVLSGIVVLQAADRCPAGSDSTGRIVAAAVGATATPLPGTGEWWAKALLTNTVVSVQSTTTTSPTGSSAAVLTTAADPTGTAGVDLAAAILVSVAADGTLQPTSSSDTTQFGKVAGFTLLAVSAGAAVPFTMRDSLTNSAWALTPGEPVFAGQNGGVTQVEPVIGFVQPVGLAVSTTTIVADFGAPTLL